MLLLVWVIGKGAEICPYCNHVILTLRYIYMKHFSYSFAVLFCLRFFVCVKTVVVFTKPCGKYLFSEVC